MSPAFETFTINLALQILREAAPRANRENIGTIEVRLSLRVLWPYVADKSLLIEYWSAATTDDRHPWTSCNRPYGWIVKSLLASNWVITPENAAWPWG